MRPDFLCSRQPGRRPHPENSPYRAGRLQFLSQKCRLLNVNNFIFDSFGGIRLNPIAVILGGG